MHICMLENKTGLRVQPPDLIERKENLGLSVKIRVEDVAVIFGKDPRQEALPLLQQGMSKPEIREKTGHVVGVAGVSFDVQEGEVFVVMGLSGSGKSTLIRCLNRLITPTSGKVLIDDEDILTYNETQLRELRRNKIAMVFQHFALLPHKTVIENVAYGLKTRGVKEEQWHDVALDALDMVGLKQEASSYPHNLSGGMQQRVGLARALATDADILLMDEAFSALDPLIRRQMQNELLQLQDSLQKTVVFITHDLNEALRVGNHVAIMRDGGIVQIGTPVDIITKPADEYVAAFMQDVDQSRVLTAGVIMQTADYLELENQEAVQKVIHRARERDSASDMYIVDRQRKVSGLIQKQNLMRAARKGQTSLREYVERDYPQVGPDTPLNEMYTLVSNGVPVAVTDHGGRLVGTVAASDILSSLASVEEVAEQGDVQEVAGTGDIDPQAFAEAASAVSAAANENGTGVAAETAETTEKEEVK